MPENILVVEYEPRYIERVRQALTGQPFAPSFARDGEEALRALQTQHPSLIVLSSVIPKVSTPDIIRAIRNEKSLEGIPILLTVAGYNGTAPRSDALRLGASDILPKPYSESDFLEKIQQILGVGSDRQGTSPGHVVRPATKPSEEGRLTSDQIFGDLIDDKPQPAQPRPRASATGDVDKMLADTLAGVMPPKRKDGLRPPTSPGNELKPKTHSGSTAIDKIVQDTLSGLEKGTRRTPSTPPPPAASAPPPAPSPSTPMPPAPVAAPMSPSATPSPAGYVEKVPASQPVFPPAPAVAVDEEEPADGTRFGQYVLLERIASGGMAEVWKARMRGVEGFQKIVAIKKILPHLSADQDFIEMFIDEAKLAAQLNHNNIIHIYDLGKIQNSYYIAMEYVDGSDLKTILRRGHERDLPLTPELALFVAAKIASALDYAHRKRDFNEQEMGLVHRDVSPQNVLISAEGDIKLCDFGIAKAATKASHTQTGALKGKLQYMSPEQAWGKPIDRRADVFALATVLFEMLTGRKLFTGDSELAILDQVREARVVAPSELNDEVTPAVDAIVLKALQKEPEDRYQTAGEFARDIDQVLYEYRPTPTAADLAIYMHHLSETPAPAPPIIEAPEPETPVEAPVVAPIAESTLTRTRRLQSAAPAAASEAAPASAAVATTSAPHPIFAAPARKKSPVLAIAIIAVLAIAGAAAFFFMRGNNTPSPQTVTPVPPRASLPAAVDTAASATAAVSSTAPTPTTASTSPTSTQPALDQAQVDAEVQRRLQAERARLQPTAAQPQTQTAAAPAAATARPVVPAPTPAVSTQAPPPAVAETRSSTPPVQPAPTQPVETRPVAAPAPAPQPAEAPRVREGDLVPTGTEGLAPARIIKQAVPQYPPMARAQRVQGTVIVSALVSETGQVIETRVLRGVPRGFGMDESAVQAVRQSTFTPGTKDGVRVKSWATVSVNFRL